MKSYRTFVFYFAAMVLFLLMWFEHLHVNSVSIIKDVNGLLNMTNEYSGFNYFIQHLTLYLFCEEMLLMQTLPRMDSQVVTRTTRWKQWKKNIFCVLRSVVIYTFLFHIVHIVLLHTRSTWNVLFKLDLLTVMAINFLMMGVTYMLWNGVFLLLYSLFLRKDIAAVLTIVVAVMMFFLDRNLGILNIPYPVFQLFYTVGIDLWDFFSALILRGLFSTLLFFLSGIVYEKKDLLND